MEEIRGWALGRLWFVMWRNTPSAIGERPCEGVVSIEEIGDWRVFVQMLPRQTKRTETGFCADEFVEAVMVVVV
jgi:hypothetical protein